MICPFSLFVPGSPSLVMGLPVCASHTRQSYATE